MVQRLQHALRTSVPPVAGLNTTSAVSSMAETDAVEMDNVISEDYGVAVREGWREYATGFPDAVQTIMSYEGATMASTTPPITQSVLFAATKDGIFDIEGGGDFSAAVPAIVLSGAPFAGRFSFVQFSNEGGQWLVACSETDGAFLFDGVTWIKYDLIGTGPGHVTGADPAKFVQVCAYKHRLCFIERGTGLMWYLAVDELGGLLTLFDFGPLLRHGGNILACINWTQDAGQGVDDHLVILGSSGDLVIYRGNDPDTDFENVGTWFIGQPPVGRRCFTESGGNIYVLTVYGVIPVTQVVQGGIDTLLTSGTEQIKQLRKIQDALNVDFATLVDTVGWEVMHIPHKAMLFIARPVSTAAEFIQYAYKEHSMAWSRLLDIPAETFGRRLNEVYGGTDDGRVLRVLDGNRDGMLLDATGAHEIRARLTPAFSYFGDPTTIKQSLMARVNFLADANPGYIVAMNTDFQRQPPGSAPPPGLLTGALWDVSMWDGSYWAGSRQAFGEWRSVEGMGYSLAPTVYISALQPTTVASIEIMVKPGGPL